jgi:hypothetical protein
MKHLHVYTLFLMSVFHTSCGQNQTTPPHDNTGLGYSESQLKAAVTSKVPVGYDAKSLYNKMPTVTEIKPGGRMEFLGILEANDGSIWYGAAGPESGVHRYDGKTITHFKSKEGQK